MTALHNPTDGNIYSFFCAQDNLNIIHQSIQCLANKILSLDNVPISKNYNCDILLLTRVWQNSDQLSAVKLSNFILKDSFCRKTLKHGGVALYMNTFFRSNTITHPVNEFCEGVLECCCVELTYYKTFIVVMYRPPSEDFNLFLNLCNGLLNKLYSTDKSIIIGGDFNINFLNHSTNLSLFKDLLLCFDLHTTANSPIRVTSFSSTCLDNFLITSNMDNFKTCVADLYLSDHYSQILSIHIQ